VHRAKSQSQENDSHVFQVEVRNER
jgi:hypothetical protein